VIPLAELKKSIVIHGIKNYILVSADGSVKARDNRDLVSLAAFVGRCHGSCSARAGSRVRFLVFSRTGGQGLVVVPAGRYCLGVTYPPGADPAPLIRQALACTDADGAPTGRGRGGPAPG
jgi:hypothetical protein